MISVLGRGAAAERVVTEEPPRPSADHAAALRVAIVGGGIAGLASAYFVAKAGHVPVVLEASDQLGGLGTHFEHDGISIERFYHVIVDSDVDLLGLITELGVADRLRWQEAGMGFLVDRVLYPFNTPADLMRFRALRLRDRLRTGLAALYMTKLKKRALDLDEISARDWVLRLFGPGVYERIWDPLLRAKFGDRSSSVPAFWLWSYINREKSSSQQINGCMRYGYRGLAESLRGAILARGGEIHMRAPVAAIEANGSRVIVEAGRHEDRFDAVISTLPLPLLAKVARGELASTVPIPHLKYQGVVNVLVISRARLERFYWTPVVDPSFPFQGVVETTTVIPTEWTGGRHLIYLMNYCGAESETFSRPDETLKREAIEGLAAVYPGFKPADVEAVYVFRAPHVEPAWTLGYLRERPAPRVGESRVYLCTTAQAYPRVTSWNTSVGLARETVSALLGDLAPAAAAARASRL